MRSNQQLEIIESMLIAGHRSVHLDRHSLLLWGIGGGALVAFTELVITPDRFPETPHRAFALLLWLTFWIGSCAWIDHRLTRHFRAAREETLPFAQSQINRAWCLLFFLGTLGTFATFFFGGGMMVYAMWMVLLGIGIYLYGLFSRPLIEWIGIATLLLGITSLAVGLPLGTARFLTASAFAAGLPLIGVLVQRIEDSDPVSRIAGVGIWLSLVIVPAYAMAHLDPARPTPSAPTISLNDLNKVRLSDQPQTLHLPAGTVIPLKVDLNSSLIAISPLAALPVQLTQPLDVLLDKGQPEGRYRFAGSPWRSTRDGELTLHISAFVPAVEDGRPIIKATAQMDLNRID